MARYYQIKRECDRKNQVRNVVNAERVRMSDFWNSARGSFFISGGSETMRVNVMLDKIERAAEQCTMPTVILNSSSEFEEKLIRRIQESKKAKLIVFSKKYRNYHFFYGMSNQMIARYLYDAAQELGYAGDSYMKSYIQAFLAVLEKVYVPSLQSILSLSGYSDSQIANLGERYGVQKKKIDILKNHAGCGELFRDLMDDLMDVFKILTTKECESQSSILTMARGANTILLINTKSSHPFLINHYFEFVLREMTKQAGFRLILSGIQLQEDDGLLGLIRESFALPGIETGLCAKSLPAVVRDEELLKSFHTQVIFPAGESTANLITLLEGLGDYMHYEPVISGGKPPRPFAIWTDTKWEAKNYIRDRVRIEDVSDSSAVLRGNMGDQVTLARNIL